jgi:dnd system-associated protein 4
VSPTQRDRFYVQKDKHPTFKRLSEQETGPFEHLKDAFVFCAAMGFRFDRRVPIEGGTQHVGFWHYLAEDRDVPILRAIAVAATGGLDVLADQGDVIAIAEEYANGGVQIVTDLERLDRDATLVSIAREVLDLAKRDSVGTDC